MRPKEIKIIAVFLLVATFQLAWHWFLSMRFHVSEILLRFYLGHNSDSQKGVSGYLDLALPVCILGISLGRIGWRFSILRTFCLVLFMAIGLNGMLPLYMIIIGPTNVWWWPQTGDEMVAFFFKNFFQTIALLGVCAYGGRGWSEYLHGEGEWNKVPPKTHDGSK